MIGLGKGGACGEGFICRYVWIDGWLNYVHVPNEFSETCEKRLSVRDGIDDDDDSSQMRREMSSAN